jgi:anti-sigma regulatory factor (Ser/Thr protein kinase)
MKTSQSYAASQQSVGAARRFVSELITDLTPEQQDAVILMVSELATNALVHAASGFQLTIDRTKTRLRVSVADLGAGTPSLQSPPSRQPHGRGLRIVEELSDEWGTSEAPKKGKTVWFRLNLTAPAQAGRQSAAEAGRQRDGRQPSKDGGGRDPDRMSARSDASTGPPRSSSDRTSRAHANRVQRPGASRRRRIHARTGPRDGRVGSPYAQRVATCRS